VLEGSDAGTATVHRIRLNTNDLRIDPPAGFETLVGMPAKIRLIIGAVILGFGLWRLDL